MGNIKVKGKMQRVAVINDNRVVARAVRRGETTDIGKLIKVAQPEVERLSATHGKTSHCTMDCIGIGAVLALDEGNEIVDEVTLEISNT